MYKKIVVPLDGSKLAECVLPHLEQIAKGCGTEDVVLVSITELVKGSMSPEDEYKASVTQPAGPIIYDLYTTSRGEVMRPPAVVSVKTGKMWQQAWRYLERIARRLDKKGIRVQLSVRLGDPAEQITGLADEGNADLILMASHGRSGVSRWAHGSVAERVFRAAGIPVLMIKAPVGTPDKLGRR